MTPPIKLLMIPLLALLVAACVSDDEPTTGADPTSEVSTGDGGQASAAPGEFPDALTVIVANSPGTVTATGSQRVLTALLGGGGPNEFLGGPDSPIDVVFRLSESPEDQVERIRGEWLKTPDAPLGLYVTYHEFSEPGVWEVRAESDGRDLGGTLLQVVEESTVPNLGDAAPRSDSPVAEGDDIGSISTDPNPDPEFYDLTIGDAVGNGQPSVIVFATPAFCQTALCGPTIETVKQVVAGRDGLDVVHVEPFDLELAPTGDLRPVETMSEWGVATEPWVFVVDADGNVSASFEGIISAGELTDALNRL